MYIIKHSQTTETVAPVEEPITLAEAKEWLRVDSSDEHELITALISAARRSVEKNLSRSIIERTMQAKVDSFAYLYRIPFPPVTDVTAVSYYNTESPQILTPLNPSDWIVHADRGILEMKRDIEVPTYDHRLDAIHITFKTGVDVTSSPEGTLPSDMLTAMKMIMASMYENRESVTIGQGYVVLKNPTVQWLLEPYRSHR